MEEDESDRDSGSSVLGEEKTFVQVKKNIIICKVCKADITRGDELTMN